ncbi:MAG TPA: ATP-binding protein, partial [Bacteroidales bacterium]|nr:ATP-binding protein [Bacteroidales bacterium]
MLKENYQSVESTKYLIQSLDEIKNQQSKYLLSDPKYFNDSLYHQNIELFRKHLKALEGNITESGEDEIIKNIKNSFNQYIDNFKLSFEKTNYNKDTFFLELIPSYDATQSLIIDLWDMNMDAISYKNSLLKNTAHRAFVIISFIGTICFIISSLVFFQYPKNISKPIVLLTQGIKEIAKRNYEQRIQIDSNDEFGELAEAFNTMAAKLDEYEHSNLSELLFEKKRIDTIINNMKDSIIGLNERNEVIFSNTLACQLLNVNANDIIGLYAPDLAAKNDIFHNIFKDVIKDATKQLKEFKPIKLEINETPTYFTKEILDVNLIKTGETSTVNVGKVIVLKNITRFLEQDEAKTNFIATISHELKTPISSLRLNLKLLKDNRIGSLNSEQLSIIEALQQETNKMLKITSELLDLAQVETGNIQLNIQPSSPVQIINYAQETSLHHAKAKHINLQFRIEDNLPFIMADSEKTTWVLLNLINNAIQYSDFDSIIDISTESLQDAVLFKVQDYGIGIEEQYLKKIFDKFFRVPGSSQKGTGLGLAISKEFITKQNGKIWAESTPGKGSSFYFSLPVYKNILKTK